MAPEILHTFGLQVDLHNLSPGGGIELCENAGVRHFPELLRSQGASARDAHFFSRYAGPYERMFCGSAILLIEDEGFGEIVHAAMHDDPGVVSMVRFCPQRPHPVTRGGQCFEWSGFSSFSPVIPTRGYMYNLCFCLCTDDRRQDHQRHYHFFHMLGILSVLKLMKRGEGSIHSEISG